MTSSTIWAVRREWYKIVLLWFSHWSSCFSDFEREVKQFSLLLLEHSGFECRCRTRLVSGGVSQTPLLMVKIHMSTIVGVLPTHYGVTTCIWFLFSSYCAEGVCLSVCDLLIVRQKSRTLRYLVILTLPSFCLPPCAFWSTVEMAI